jgi:hypothetical protein
MLRRNVKMSAYKVSENVFLTKRNRLFCRKERRSSKFFSLFVTRPLLYLTGAFKFSRSLSFLRKSLDNARLHKTTKVSAKMFSTQRSRKKNRHCRVSYPVRCRMKSSTRRKTQASRILTSFPIEHHFLSDDCSKKCVSCYFH